jgi:outer membrane immunogenic protein
MPAEKTIPWRTFNRMRIKSAVLALALALFCIPAMAQFSGHSEISAAFTGNFQKQASGTGPFVNTKGDVVTDTPTHAGGFLLNYRYDFSNWNAVEVNYAQTRFAQSFKGPGGESLYAQSNVRELTMAYVNTLGFSAEARFRPFVEAGTGGLIFSPIVAGTTGETGAPTEAQMAFLYGGGVDVRAIPHFAIRLGYRGLIYKATDFADFGVGPVTNMAEPYVGVVFHF